MVILGTPYLIIPPFLFWTWFLLLKKPGHVYFFGRRPNVIFHLYMPHIYTAAQDG